jgi:hypothetical protein
MLGDRADQDFAHVPPESGRSFWLGSDLHTRRSPGRGRSGGGRWVYRGGGRAGGGPILRAALSGDARAAEDRGDGAEVRHRGAAFSRAMNLFKEERR